MRTDNELLQEACRIEDYLEEYEALLESPEYNWDQGRTVSLVLTGIAGIILIALMVWASVGVH